MNKLTTIIALMGLVLCNAAVQAEDQPVMQPGPKQMGGMQGQGMGGMQGMRGMMQMSPEQKEAHMRAMQEHMLMMHDYSDKILAEKDPVKKQKLKDEQLELMKAHHMQMMKHRKKMMQMKQNKMQKMSN